MAEREISRREFLKKSAILSSGLVVGGTLLSKTPGEGATEQPSQDKKMAPEVVDLKDEVAIQPEHKTEDKNIEWLPEPVKQLWPTIQDIAKEYNLDPRLIAIIITEESGGLNVANTEGSGAIGPMQLMQIAMEEYRQHSGDSMPRYISNPQDNIRVGSWLVSSINDRYIKSAGIDMYSDLGILMLAVGYGDGIGVLSGWQKGGMQRSHLSAQAKNVSRLWTGMWHEKDQLSSQTLNSERGYNT